MVQKCHQAILDQVGPYTGLQPLFGKHNNYCHLGTEAEAFDAELYAIHEGLLYISNSDLKICHLIL
jgi:hypothetical protein